MNCDLMHNIFQITSSSFRHLYDQHFDSICRFLYFYSNDRMVIEEIVQDVFVKLWEDRDKIRIKSIKTYLLTSARNRMLNHIRDRNRHNLLIEKWVQYEMEKRQGEECFDIEDFSQKVDSAIDNLPEKCRIIFNLSKKKNLTYRQIAKQLNISVKTVETQMGIALRKIREQLISLYPR